MEAGCMPKANSNALTIRPFHDACYSRILLMLEQGTTAWATGGAYVIYTWPLPVMRVVVM